MMNDLASLNKAGVMNRLKRKRKKERGRKKFDPQRLAAISKTQSVGHEPSPSEEVRRTAPLLPRPFVS